MRITIAQGAFLPVPPLLGGAVEKVWFNLGREFARRGHEVTHLSRRHPDLPTRETIEGVRHVRVSGFSSPARISQRLLLDFWYALRLSAKLPPADLLVTNTFWLPALPHRRSRGLPYVHVARFPKGQLKLYRNAVLQTVSEAIRQAILAELPNAAKRLRVIPYPLSEHHLRPAVAPASQTILYAGRVHPEKGIHLLIQAFAQLPSADRMGWKLQIVGPWDIALGGGGDTYLAELHASAAPAAGDIEFVGPVFDEKRLVAYYENARLFVYPSLAEQGETFGLAVLEAMAAGCVPLVSDLACFRDFIRADVNGQIFDHRAPQPADRLAAVLATLMRSPASTQPLRESAWLTARDYTVPKIASQFLADFSQLTGQPVVPNLAPAPNR
ncbi:MAG: glycosyltransferase family 4 protein [Nibricoccus sp.]